ncbi:MAG TPA: PA2779 family protein [Methylomirabilota bacterium]|nr:PA2779 family protein [Methylomirabilota bacterium]
MSSGGRRRYPRPSGVVALVIVLAAASVATAAPIPPGFVEPVAGEVEMTRLVRLLESRVAGSRLEALGLSREAVRARLAALDDRELHELVRTLPELGAGADDRGWEERLGTVLLYTVAIILFAGVLYLAIAGF